MIQPFHKLAPKDIKQSLGISCSSFLLISIISLRYFQYFCALIIVHKSMKRLQLDYFDSSSREEQFRDVIDGGKSQSNPQKGLRISVISHQDSVERYIMQQGDENININGGMNEEKAEQEGSSDKTRSLGKPTHPTQGKLEEIQATLKPAPTSQPPTNPQQPANIIRPSENKSHPPRKERFRQWTRQDRDRPFQSKQSHNLNQTFVIDRKLISEQKELNICDTKIYFPYEPYEVQIQYMKNVLEALMGSGNAVLESPTGTGKTLCLLASVLSFVEKQYRGEKKLRHNVIYMSRTHSQLRQVQKELSKTCYRPNMGIFASREQLCLKESLAMLKGKEKIEACGKGVKLARKIKKEQPAGEIDPKIMETVCEFYRERQEMVTIGRRRLANTLVDIDIMRQVGQEEMFCPYFYPIQTKDFTNLFIMPYNYLLDSFLIGSYQQIIQNSIIIFDEAHNISEAACEGRSLQVETHHFDSALLQLNKLLSRFLSPSLESVRAQFEKQIKFLVMKIQDFKETFTRFINDMMHSQEEGGNRRDSFRDQADVRVVNKEKTDFALFELFCGPVQDERRKEYEQRKDYYRSLMISKLILPIQEFTSYGVVLIEELKETPDGVFSNFERVLIFCLKVKNLLAPRVYQTSEKVWVDDEFNHFRLYVNRNSGNTGGNGSYTVGMRCLVPWLTFKDILRFKPRSILLTSGTLKPLSMWQKQLKMKFSSQLSNRHVISPEQIAARVIRAGPSKVRFTFTFDNLSRNKNEIYRDLIDFLIESASRIPNGILLVFPSFKIQLDFKYELMRSSKKDKLAAFKDIIFEEKSMDINMNDFKRKALSSKGAILAIICRGKVSQGIDFPDGMCRAVFIIGVPYPNIKDPFIIEKKNHLENMAARSVNRSQAISGEEWYFMGTVRAVNQALGRVIRHAMDYGMVFLLDNRYCDNKMQKELPTWITQSMEVIEHLQGDFYSQIGEFYKNMGVKYKPREEEMLWQKREKEEGEGKKKTNALQLLMGNQKQKERVRRRRIRIKDPTFDSFDF